MIVGIIQARTGSSRLPGKILMKAAGKTLLEHMIERISNSKKLDKRFPLILNKLTFGGGPS